MILSSTSKIRSLITQSLTLIGIVGSLSACQGLDALLDKQASTSEDQTQKSETSVVSRNLRIQATRPLTLQEQSRIRLGSIVNIRDLSEAGILELRVDQEPRSILIKSQYNFDLLQTIPLVENAIRNAVPKLLSSNKPIFAEASQDPKLTEIFIETVREELRGSTLSEELLSAEEFERLTNILVDTLRNDLIEINSQIFFEMKQEILGMDPMESIREYMGRYGIEVRHESRVVMGNQVDFYTHGYEAGNSNSGDWVAIDQDGSVVRGDHDKNDNGINDDINDDPNDGRGDGNGFLDDLNDLIYGDDGDGITHESEGGVLMLTEIEKLAHSYSVLASTYVRDLIVHSNSVFKVGALIDVSTSSRISSVNQWAASRAGSLGTQIQKVQFNRPVQR